MLSYFKCNKMPIIFFGLIFSFTVGLGQQQPILPQDTPPDMQIMLQSFKFDPLKQVPEIPKNLRAEQVTGKAMYRIVQFKRPLARKQMELLKSQYGLKLAHFISNNSYLEQLTNDQINNLSQLSFYRWTGLYHPAYKIAPLIGEIEFRNPEDKARVGILLRAILHDDADTVKVTEKLTNIGASNIKILDDRLYKGALRARFSIPSASLLIDIAKIEEVFWIEEVAEINEDNVNTSGTWQSGTPGITPVWNQGINGERQIIGIIDSSPIDTAHCFFRDPTNNTPRPDHRKVLDIRNLSGTAAAGHASFVAGNAAGDDFNNPGTANRRGGAWASRLVSGNSRDIRGGLTTMLAELNGAMASGATIHSNSWHDNTAGAGNPATYNQTAVDVDNFTWNNEDHLVLGSAGNVGEEQGPPGTAKNAICVGATRADPNEMNFGDGNSGPTSDGRRKPDLMTPGCGIQSATSGTVCGTGPRAACATSYATPHTAAAAALVRQYYTEGWYPSGIKQPHHSFVPSGALLKATLLNSTINMTGIAGYPGNQEGWGLIQVDNVLFFQGDLPNLLVWDVRNADGLFTGESNNHSVNVSSNTIPLKITLVWTDPPSTNGNANPVINNIDLVVTSPDGITTFLGNDFAAGQSTTGGAADNLNNVEMVLVNTPQVGEYTIQINGTQVNVGDPGQGYALVVTADTEDPPVPTGNQNLLVVRTKFNDITFEPPLPNLTNTINDAVTYFNEVAYGEVTILPTYRGPFTLDNPKSFYYHPSRNLLIELTEEVIAKLVAAEPGVFNGIDPTDPADDIDRIIIVTNDPDFTDDWATTGPWPYSLPTGLTRRISVSIQGYDNNVDRFTHGLGHQFGLVDLYAHPNVVFSQPHVETWCQMGKPFTGCHFMAWNKERATWLTTRDASSVMYIPRPPVGPPVNQTIPIDYLSSNTFDNAKTIAIGLTEGAADITDENVFYFIEARTNSPGSADEVLPNTGTLLYYVNENIRQGEGPVRIIDNVVSTPSLSDAVLTDGVSHSPAGTGLTITSTAGTGTADKSIQISYDPPDTDNDVNIRVGDPAYTSPDIWIDSQKDGFDEDMGRTPMDRGDQPVTAEVNRVYFHVHNPGPSHAYDFTVYVRVSEPYHTVGGRADFDTFVGEKFVVQLDAGDDLIDYVEWTPADDGNPHTCAWVEIPNVFNDVNDNNNAAQQNLNEVPSSHGSPYDIVTYRFGFTNPENSQELFYFRAEDVPEGWIATLNPAKAMLSASERIECTLTIAPPENAVVCTEHRISVTSWMPRGDTMIPVGGGAVQVDLRNRTELMLQTDIIPCKQDSLFRTRRTHLKESYVQYKGCIVITSQGCTNPPRPNEEIVLRYEDPYGYPVYRTVVTDEYGCFSDSYVVTEGGAWEVTAEYPGDDCSGPALSDNVIVSVPLYQTGDQDGDTVPDGEEPQGDHDRDGLVGKFDPDSDGDGLNDGEESAGDCDRDGHDNIVDTDSDNDGIPDGQDSTPCGGIEKPQKPHNRFMYSFHVGSTHPVDNLDSLADANINFHIDASYLLNDRFNLKLMLGINQFTAESSTGIDHPLWINASANIQAVFPTSTGLKNYLQVGPGWYKPKSGSSEFGFNIGVGWQIPIPALFNLEFGLDFHQIQTKDPTRFITAHLGVLFR